MEQAKRLLRELAETNNAMQSNEIFNLADEQGISKRTLENAKKELGIRAKRINNTWYWELDKIRQRQTGKVTAQQCRVLEFLQSWNCVLEDCKVAKIIDIAMLRC